MTAHKTTRGNILFLILLAVVLFAALAYAVTSSMRGGGRDGSVENIQAQLASLDNYFAQLNSAIQRMMMTGGVRDYELNFYYQNPNKFVYGSFDNTNCTESRCRVYDPAGGAVIGRNIKAINNPAITAGAPEIPRIQYISIPGVGTSAPDIVLVLMSVDKEVCKAMNAKAGISGIIYNIALIGTGPERIMYQNTIPVGPIPDVGAQLNGVTPTQTQSGTFCVCSLGSEGACQADLYSPMGMHVLVAR